MKFLAGSTLQKVLATIVAAIMSFSVLTPAISNTKSNHKPTGIVQTVKKVDGKIVAVTPEVKATEETTEEEQTAPETQEEEATAPEVQEEATAPEAQEEETTAPEENLDSEPIAQWDVSATDEDDVQMYYYADDSFLDTIAGAVKALFVPMTAFAEENEGQEEESITLTSGVTYRGGTIYITGEGSTQGMLFFEMIDDFDEFGVAYENWVRENARPYVFSLDQAYALRTDIDDKGFLKPGATTVTAEEAHERFTTVETVTNTQTFYDDETDEYYEETETYDVITVDYSAMFDLYLPWQIINMVTSVDNFWDIYGKFTPTKIVIDQDAKIDTIGFAAFAFFPSITEVVFNGTVRNIASGAFAGTNITELILPDGVTTIGSDAFAGCYSLGNVYLPESLGYQDGEGKPLGYIGEYAFSDMPTGSVIECATEDVLEVLVDDDDYGTASVESGQTRSMRNYNSAGTRIKITGCDFYI